MRDHHTVFPVAQRHMSMTTWLVLSSPLNHTEFPHMAQVKGTQPLFCFASVSALVYFFPNVLFVQVL
jgi:hypothetical protein